MPLFVNPFVFSPPGGHVLVLQLSMVGHATMTVSANNFNDSCLQKPVTDTVSCLFYDSLLYSNIFGTVKYFDIFTLKFIFNRDLNYNLLIFRYLTRTNMYMPFYILTQ